MKLYQGLTQVQVNDDTIDGAKDFTITTELTKPLHYSPSLLYRYINSVLKSGSRHDENNLRFVSDPAYIGENYDYKSNAQTATITDFEDKMTFARNVVADLNRHVAVNIDTTNHEFELIFVD